MDKVSTKPKIQNVGSNWHPKDPMFRDEFVKRIFAAIDHFERYGDTRVIESIVLGIPDKEFRFRLATLLEQKSPLKIRNDGRLVKDPNRSSGRPTPQEMRRLPWGRKDFKAAQTEQWGNPQTNKEFFDDILDWLVMNRSEIGLDQLQQLLDVTTKIMARKKDLVSE